MRQTLVLSGFGVAMWGAVTLFFMLFGDWILVDTGNPQFGASLFLLEALTVFVLIGIALIVRLRLFRVPGSASRLGYISAAIGLLFNTFTIWHKDKVFPDFNEGQFHAFTIWMTLAYALFLLVPALVDRLVRTTPRGMDQTPHMPEAVESEHAE